MKRILLSLSCIILCFILIGCNLNLNNISLSKKKPNNFYYTNNLAKNLTLETSCTCIALDTNFYKEKEIPEEDIASIRSILKALNKKNFISKPSDLPAKPIYKIFLTFTKSKMVINVYNEKFISIYPWDGDYEMDYIDMTGVPSSLNLYSICKYWFK